MSVSAPAPRSGLLGLLAMVPLAGCAAQPLPAGGGPGAGMAPGAEVQIVPVAGGLARPVDIVHAGDGSGRLFIVEQGGRIVVQKGAATLRPPFLDLSGKVLAGSERGLLGLAFHPGFARNGLLYVNYTRAPDGATVIARYHVAADPGLADPASERVLLVIEQPYEDHHGRQLRFGPDGYLYIALGDGGSGGDPGAPAQDLTSLLGKLLRIDVDAAEPYAIPAGNPFSGDPDARPEIWAYGLRDPWRFSFDRAGGDLVLGDVGESKWEELHYQPATSRGGENYGWRLMEGSECHHPAKGCDDGSLMPPVVAYGHAWGCGVTGGFVYRGAAIPDLYGTYVYGDYCSGRVWGARPAGLTEWQTVELLHLGANLSTFGEDEAGELYLADHTGGTVYRIAALQ